MIFQAGGAMLELCILAVLKQEDTYGYKLISRIAKPLGLSESTLYPVLRRLSKNGYLTVYDQSHDGRNRRYYHLSASGLAYLTELENDWDLFTRTINEITGKEDTELHD